MKIPQGLSSYSVISAFLVAIASVPSLMAADLTVTGGINWGSGTGDKVSFKWASGNNAVSYDLNNGVGRFLWREWRSGSAPTQIKMALGENNVLTLNDTSGSTAITLTPNTGTISATAFQSTGAMTSSGVMRVNSTTASTSSSSGALVVSGGLGVVSDSFINGIRIGEGGGSISGNTALGAAVLANNTTGGSNAGSGYYVLNKNTTGSNNTGLGRSALANNTTGSSNVAVGTNAGSYLHNGTAFLSDPESSIYIGANSRGYSNADNNSIVIGAGALGAGANTTVIGTTATTQAFIYGNVVTGGITVNGPAVLSEAQGDVSMGQYGN